MFYSLLIYVCNKVRYLFILTSGRPWMSYVMKYILPLKRRKADISVLPKEGLQVGGPINRRSINLFLLHKA